MIIDDRLPNPFFRMTKEMSRDVLLEKLERDLAGAGKVALDPVFLARLEAAVLVLAASADDPVRHSRGMRIVARLRELAP